MVAFVSRLIFVVIFLLAGTSVATEVPVFYPKQDSVANKKVTTDHPTSKRGLQWEILPGEDILQIARLMFPNDSAARDNFIRAIIHINPEHFPAGTYQPVSIGTIIQIPDLKIIDAYSEPSDKTRESSIANNLPRHESQAAPKATEDNLISNYLLPRITRLEQNAEKETRDLNTLIKRIESLAVHVAEIQSALSLNAAKRKEKQTASASVSLATSIMHLEDSEAPTQDSTPHFESILPEKIVDVLMEIPLFLDTLLLIGIVLTLLIVIVMLRNYRKKLPPSANASVLSGTEEPHQYKAMLRHHHHEADNLPQDTSIATGQTMAESHPLIKQDNPEATVQLLQKQLAINPNDISAWLHLFELLYKLGNKQDFKKHARRFKRLGEFPDIWTQIQDLGNHLEPDEPLYFDEQKRKEKFFS